MDLKCVPAKARQDEKVGSYLVHRQMKRKDNYNTSGEGVQSVHSDSDTRESNAGGSSDGQESNDQEGNKG